MAKRPEIGLENNFTQAHALELHPRAVARRKTQFCMGKRVARLLLSLYPDRQILQIFIP